MGANIFRINKSTWNIIEILLYQAPALHQTVQSLGGSEWSKILRLKISFNLISNLWWVQISLESINRLKISKKYCYIRENIVDVPNWVLPSPQTSAYLRSRMACARRLRWMNSCQNYDTISVTLYRTRGRIASSANDYNMQLSYNDFFIHQDCKNVKAAWTYSRN